MSVESTLWYDRARAQCIVIDRAGAGRGASDNFGFGPILRSCCADAGTRAYPLSRHCGIVVEGAYDTRYLALQGEADIEFSRDEFWHFPANVVLVRNFYLEFTKGDPASRQIVETRFLVKVGASEQWQGFSYKWNDDSSDAVLMGDRETLAFLFKIRR